MKPMSTLVVLAVLVTGCAAIKDHVVVSTSTVLGFEAAQNPATGMYQARLGYGRAELALVPTNNIDVITELRWNNVLSSGGLYQRMAIGKTACENSLFMFLKSPDGSLDPRTLTAAHQILSLKRSTNN